jgi:RsiW-degrading membrane proteinase PrsW (M82 family)
MRGANFVSFFTVGGFFVGVVFALLKAQGAFDLLIYIFLITTFFYLFSHLFIAMYVGTMTIKPTFFPKKTHEKDLDYFIREINKRELIIDSDYTSNIKSRI